MNISQAPQAFVRPNGNGYDLSPAAVLLMAADALYGDPSETTPEGRKNAQAVVEGLIAAAIAGGYKQADILQTKLSQRNAGKDVIVMAMNAMRTAGNQRVFAALANAGLRPDNQPPQ